MELGTLSECRFLPQRNPETTIPLNYDRIRLKQKTLHYSALRIRSTRNQYADREFGGRAGFGSYSAAALDFANCLESFRKVSGQLLVWGTGLAARLGEQRPVEVPHDASAAGMQARGPSFLRTAEGFSTLLYPCKRLHPGLIDTLGLH